MKGVALFGATGTIGCKIRVALQHTATLRLSGATASVHNEGIGRALTEQPGAPVLQANPRWALEGADAAIDVSTAEAVEDNLAACVERSIPAVICVTGLSEPTRRAIELAGARIALLVTANTSVAIAVMAAMAELAAARLPSSFDPAVSEIHHRAKRDCPSGTAFMLKDAVDSARAKRSDASPESAAGRSISIQGIRVGEAIGTHTILFAGADETIEITHRATDRGVFARGALDAVQWLLDQHAGVYSMKDLLTPIRRA